MRLVDSLRDETRQNLDFLPLGVSKRQIHVRSTRHRLQKHIVAVMPKAFGEPTSSRKHLFVHVDLCRDGHAHYFVPNSNDRLSIL